jgi:hypothetical protein
MDKTRAKMDRLGLALGLLAFSAIPALAASENFLPLAGGGLSISATTTSAFVTLTGEALNQSDLWIVNAGGDLVFCRSGIGATTATTAGLPIPASTVVIISRANGADTVACRTATTTATVYIVPGVGY